MKRIITSSLAILLLIGATQAQTTATDKQKGHHKEQRMAYDKLNLSADQRARLQALRENLKKQEADLKSNNQISAEQKEARRKELHEQFRSQSAAILTPAQRGEAAKMKKEWKGKHNNGQAGKGHFKKGKGMEQSLDLSADQQQKIAALRSGFKPKAEAVRNNKSLTEDQKKAKIHALMQGQQTAMKSILTPEQMQKMESMKHPSPRKAK